MEKSNQGPEIVPDGLDQGDKIQSLLDYVACKQQNAQLIWARAFVVRRFDAKLLFSSDESGDTKSLFAEQALVNRLAVGILPSVGVIERLVTPPLDLIHNDQPPKVERIDPAWWQFIEEHNPSLDTQHEVQFEAGHITRYRISGDRRIPTLRILHVAIPWDKLREAFGDDPEAERASKAKRGRPVEVRPAELFGELLRHADMDGLEKMDHSNFANRSKLERHLSEWTSKKFDKQRATETIHDDIRDLWEGYKAAVEFHFGKK
jgi:hypothetical protein